MVGRRPYVEFFTSHSIEGNWLCSLPVGLWQRWLPSHCICYSVPSSVVVCGVIHWRKQSCSSATTSWGIGFAHCQYAHDTGGSPFAIPPMNSPFRCRSRLVGGRICSSAQSCSPAELFHQRSRQTELFAYRRPQSHSIGEGNTRRPSAYVGHFWSR